MDNTHTRTLSSCSLKIKKIRLFILLLELLYLSLLSFSVSVDRHFIFSCKKIIFLLQA